MVAVNIVAMSVLQQQGGIICATICEAGIIAILSTESSSESGGERSGLTTLSSESSRMSICESMDESDMPTILSIENGG